MSSIDQTLNEQQRDILLKTARASIRTGLSKGHPLAVNPADFEEALQAERATFVTLNERGELRGCIGHLEAIQPLIKDVADNAFSAAFQDSRFPPVSDQEFDQLEIHISVLSPPQPLSFLSEEDLLRQIRPGVDGLILEDGYYRGTFLPSVWEQLPRKEEFLAHLKLKAGLPANYWSDSLRVSRYTTESFSEPQTLT
ncbi:AmmeMemoRadiSam system protein A [Thiolapillus sp.]